MYMSSAVLRTTAAAIIMGTVVQPTYTHSRTEVLSPQLLSKDLSIQEGPTPSWEGGGWQWGGCILASHPIPTSQN